MQREASKCKLAVRKTVVSEPISAPDVDIAERILARLVALAYAGDHPEFFTAMYERPTSSTRGG